LIGESGGELSAPATPETGNKAVEEEEGTREYGNKTGQTFGRGRYFGARQIDLRCEHGYSRKIEFVLKIPLEIPIIHKGKFLERHRESCKPEMEIVAYDRPLF